MTSCDHQNTRREITGACQLKISIAVCIYKTRNKLVIYESDLAYYIEILVEHIPQNYNQIKINYAVYYCNALQFIMHNIHKLYNYIIIIIHNSLCVINKYNRYFILYREELCPRMQACEDDIYISYLRKIIHSQALPVICPCYSKLVSARNRKLYYNDNKYVYILSDYTAKIELLK